MRPGDVLDGRYRVDAPLAKGGMGAVWRATHLGTDRLVALKVIHSDLVSSPVMLERFRREAKAAGRLSHPHVVDVTDFGLCELDGRQTAYLVMEYLHGRTLRDLLKERKKLDIASAVDIAEQVGLAVDAAHALGIVHRDLKPENIWLEPHGVDKLHAKVLDFGIAKLRGDLEVSPSQLPAAIQNGTFEDDVIVVGDVPRPVTMFTGAGARAGLADAATVTPATRGRAAAAPAPTSLGLRAATQAGGVVTAAGAPTMTGTHGQVSWRSVRTPVSDPRARGSSPSVLSTPASGQLTEVGGILGTPFYMAPEQFAGDVVDERADIYALGVCVYQMLAGDVPHRGSVGQLVLVHHDKTPPPPMPGVPGPIEALVRRALAHDPRQRPASARLFAAGLKGAAESEDTVRRRALSVPNAEIVSCVGACVVPYLVPLTALVLAAQATMRSFLIAPALVVVVAALSALATMAAAAFLRAPPMPATQRSGSAVLSAARAAPVPAKVRARSALKLVLTRLPTLPRAAVAALLGNPMTPAVLVHQPRTAGARLALLAQPVRGVLRALTLRTWACAVVVTCCIPFAALARALALDFLHTSLAEGATPSPATAAVVAAFGVVTALGPVLVAAWLQIPVSMTAVELLDNARAVAGEEAQRAAVARTAGRSRTLYGFGAAVVGVAAWLLVVNVGFEAAVLRGAAETVGVLVDLGANPNPTRTRQPLHDAAFSGKARTVKALLEGGADPNALDKLEGKNGGAPPLLAAITATSTECVRLLLEHGADPNRVAKFGETPLHAALLGKSSPERVQIVRMLLERGADAHKAGPDGRAPAEMASASGEPALEKLFAGR